MGPLPQLLPPRDKPALGSWHQGQGTTIVLSFTNLMKAQYGIHLGDAPNVALKAP